MRISSNAMRSRVISSSAANGSSISSTAGSSASARASATRCCMPPESWCGYFASKPAGRQRRSIRRYWRFRVRHRRACRPGPATGATLSLTFSHGIRFACWNTSPMRPALRRSRGGEPPILMLPRVGAIRSATTLSSVLLPQPDGPTSDTKAPSESPGRCRTAP